MQPWNLALSLVLLGEPVMHHGLAKLYPGVFSSYVVTRAMAKKKAESASAGDVKDGTLLGLSETF